LIVTWRENEGVGLAGLDGGAGLLGELIEEGVFAVVRGPDGEVVIPGDAGLGGLPEEFGVGMLGEFVESDIAAVDGHGVGVGGKGDDTGAVVEFDVADFNFFGEGGGKALRVEGFDFDEVFAATKDGAGEAEEVGEVVDVAHVFEGGGPVFGDEEVVAFGEAEAFANIFEAVAEGPADADGFFCEDEDADAAGMVGVFGFDPADLVGGEVFGEEGIGIDLNEGEDGRHRILDFRF